MNKPLVSVVIPTHGRPQFLARAIDSVFQHQGDDTEIVVVPNGRDTSWMAVVAQWNNDPRVRVSPIARAHGNAARNHGMSIAEGSYLRFLDDDDYLLSGSRVQLDAIQKSNREICVGTINIVSANNQINDVRNPPETGDFVESILGEGHVSLPHAYIYLRTALAGLSWDESVTLAQDKHWLYKLCENRDYSFCAIDDPVGVWFQHKSLRVSGGKSMKIQSQAWALMLLETSSALKTQNRLDYERKARANHRIWSLIISNYFTDRRFWKQIIERTNETFTGLKPDDSLHRYGITKNLPLEWHLRLTYPYKHCKRGLNLLRCRLGLLHPLIPP